MDPTAQFLIDKLASLERRIERLENASGQQQQQPHLPVVEKIPLKSFAVSDVENVFFHYVKNHYRHTQELLDELIPMLKIKKTRKRKVHIYVRFISGSRPDFQFDGRQLGDGYKILLFLVIPSVNVPDVSEEYQMDAQVQLHLDGSYVRFDKKTIIKEVRKLSHVIDSV